MQYSSLVSLLFEKDFTRIERDDRLLDIMPEEDREKGVELWERYTDDKIQLVRVRLPYSVKKLKFYEISKQEFDMALLTNDTMSLGEVLPLKEGEDCIAQVNNN